MSPEKSDAGSKTSKGSRNGGATEAPKRAICLAGGGPAAGLHIGVLQGLKNHGVDFNNSDAVWALSCIGAWVGIVYNQATGDKEAATTTFSARFFATTIFSRVRRTPYLRPTGSATPKR